MCCDCSRTYLLDTVDMNRVEWIGMVCGIIGMDKWVVGAGNYELVVGQLGSIHTIIIRIRRIPLSLCPSVTEVIL